MWPPEKALTGPIRPVIDDIEPLNRVFSESFTDRYGRDGMVGVRVPFLNPLVWRFALEDAGDGAMLWRDAHGQIAGFNIVHRSGTEGWMGPLAVRPDRQAEGLGGTMVKTGIEWLKARGATVIGLETMPRTVDNIGFYSRLGLAPARMTVTLVRDLGRATGLAGHPRLSGVPASAALAACRALSTSLAPGVDFTRELELTLTLRLGDASLVYDGSQLAGFALWHSAQLAAGRPKDEVRILKIVARDLETFVEVVRAVEEAAHGERVRRLALRCQTAYTEAYLRLVRAGFRVHWTDLRMTLQGYEERPTGQGIVMSNWEI